MEIYKNSIKDPRTREFLPVSRILAEDLTENSHTLIGNTKYQIYLWGTDKKFCSIRQGGFILLDFGIELHGGIRIICRTNGKIRLRFGESVSEAMKSPNQDHAIHDEELHLAGRGGYLEYGNTAFRFVRIDALEGEFIQLENVLAVALYRDIKWEGAFECSDERLNRIWKTGAYTVQLNMQEYIFDGVKRDRLTWMGDLHPEIRTILSVFKEVSIIPKTIDYIRTNTPLPLWINDIPTYSCWYIINVYEYYLYTGDMDFLREQREYIFELTGLLSKYIDGNGSECMPELRFVDWPSRNDPAGLHASIQGLMLMTFQKVSFIFRELSLDISFVDAAVKKLRCHIPDCGNNKSAAAMLTISGLKDCSEVILKDPLSGVSTFYGFYVLYAQPIVNALGLIRNYWGTMLDFGATTFWEDFDRKWTHNASRIDELPAPGKDDLHADFGNFCYKGLRHSLCHGWASGPTAFLSEKILGVKPLEPGFRKVLICPELADLDYVMGSYPTPYGNISIEADKNGLCKVTKPDEVRIVIKERDVKRNWNCHKNMSVSMTVDS